MPQTAGAALVIAGARRQRSSAWGWRGQGRRGGSQGPRAERERSADRAAWLRCRPGSSVTAVSVSGPLELKTRETGACAQWGEDRGESLEELRVGYRRGDGSGLALCTFQPVG